MDLPTQRQPGAKGWGQSSSWFSWYQKHLVTLDAELLICESLLVLHAEGKPLISSIESIETGVRHKVHCNLKFPELIRESHGVSGLNYKTSQL